MSGTNSDMRLKTEDQILDPGIRANIINEIEGTENKRRKDEAYKRWKVYKDKTDEFVLLALSEQFLPATVREMSYALTNISLVRKVVNKLARVYQNGVQRSVVDGSEEDQMKLAEVEDIFNFNQKMKKLNRILKLQKNTIAYIKPSPILDENEDEKMTIRMLAVNPYLYDAVEDFYDRTEAMAYIFSNYSPTSTRFTTTDPARVRGFDTRGTTAATRTTQQGTTSTFGDGNDQRIADKKEDEDNARGETQSKDYIWWTDKYHFTTNDQGQIIDENGNPVDLEGDELLEFIANPIGRKPVVNLAIDQDNTFWAEGGDDLVDNGILMNTLFTTMNHIGVYQGFGQFFMTGKDLPQNIPMGPTKAIILEHEIDDPEPKIGFAQASPQLAQLSANIVSLIALTLTTNELSTSGVSTNLDSTANPSGVSMMIDKAESMEDVEDQRALFVDAEDDIWDIINSWMHVLSGENMLDPKFEDLLLPENFDMKIEFNPMGSIMSEKEKLDNIEKRQDIGLNLDEELIMMDQPTLSEEEAKEKLAELEARKAKRRGVAIIDVDASEGDAETEDSLEESAERAEEREGDKDDVDESEDGE